MEIRHKLNKGVVGIDDATGEQLVESEHSIWERLEPKKAPAKKTATS